EAAFALDIDHQNKQAAQIACRLLMGRAWFVPASKTLMPKENPTILAAAFAPDDNTALVAVTADGNLRRWSGKGYHKVEDLGSLLRGKKVNQTGAGDNIRVASFSPDGKQVLFAWAPESDSSRQGGGPAGLLCEIWTYRDGAYVAGKNPKQLK